MLPWFGIYDHINYTRWGMISIADMKQLHLTAPEVHEVFMNGDFVVKESKHNFNQLLDDLALEHCNRAGKIAGGLIGITINESALHRWSLSYNERARLSADAHCMFGLMSDDGDDDEQSHKECGPSRITRDPGDVLKLVEQFERCGVFDQTGNKLICITTGDVASDDIEVSLLQASQIGSKIVAQFAQERLISRTTPFHATLKKQASKTFASLYKKSGTKAQKNKNVKGDRDFFQRIIVSVDVNLESTNKAQLAEIILETHSNATMGDDIRIAGVETCTIIDVMALLHSIGKPHDAKTFGDLADIFSLCFEAKFKRSSRVYVLFGRYFVNSIKSGERQRRRGHQFVKLLKIGMFIYLKTGKKLF